jgi:hypothetical protein
MKQATMQLLQHQNQINVHNLNNVRCEVRRHFRKKFLNAKNDEFDTMSKIKKYQRLLEGISDFKNIYRFRTIIVRNKKGDLVTDCHRILASQRNYFSQQLNVHGVNDVRQTDIHTAEPPVPERSAFDLEMAIEKLERHIARY